MAKDNNNECNKIFTPLIIKIRNGYVVECATNQGFYETITYDMKVLSKKSSQQASNFNKTLLKKSEIKNLFNYITGHNETYGMCFFNSSLQCLNASYDYREMIKRLSTQKQEHAKKLDCDIIKVLNKFISTNDDKETVFNNIQKYCEAVKQIKSIYANLAAIRDLNVQIGKATLNNRYIKEDEDTTLKKLIEENKSDFDIIMDRCQYVEVNGEMLAIKQEGGTSDAFLRTVLLTLSYQLMSTQEEKNIVADNLMIDRWNCDERIAMIVHCQEAKYGTNFGASVEIDEKHEVEDIQKHFQSMFDLQQFDTVILRLPKVLILEIQRINSQCKVPKVPETMILNDTEGTKKYKLVSATAVDTVYSNHQVADIRTQEGWITISDYGKDRIRDANMYYQPDERGFYPDRERIMLVYQLTN